MGPHSPAAVVARAAWGPDVIQLTNLSPMVTFMVSPGVCPAIVPRLAWGPGIMELTRLFLWVTSVVSLRVCSSIVPPLIWWGGKAGLGWLPWGLIHQH